MNRGAAVVLKAAGGDAVPRNSRCLDLEGQSISRQPSASESRVFVYSCPDHLPRPTATTPVVTATSPDIASCHRVKAAKSENRNLRSENNSNR